MGMYQKHYKKQTEDECFMNATRLPTTSHMCLL